MVKWFRYESDDQKHVEPNPIEPEIDPFDGLTEDELRSKLLEKVIAHLNAWNGDITYSGYDSTTYYGEYGIDISSLGFVYVRRLNSKWAVFDDVDSARLYDAERKCYGRHLKRKNIATLKAILK